MMGGYYERWYIIATVNVNRARRPHPISGVGLIDTGATKTAIDEQILTASLELNPVGVCHVGTANGQVQKNLYPGRIVFPTKNWNVDMTQCAGVDLGGQEVKEQVPKRIIALLGRDFLQRSVLICNGSMVIWTISLV